MNDTINTILSRRSIRAYTEQSVEKEKILLLLQAGMAAPSARDARPWDFIVVDEDNILQKLADGLPHAKMLLYAKLAIVVCGNLNKALTGGVQTAILDPGLCGGKSEYSSCRPLPRLGRRMDGVISERGDGRGCSLHLIRPAGCHSLQCDSRGVPVKYRTGKR